VGERLADSADLHATAKRNRKRSSAAAGGAPPPAIASLHNDCRGLVRGRGKVSKVTITKEKVKNPLARLDSANLSEPLEQGDF